MYSLAYASRKWWSPQGKLRTARSRSGFASLRPYPYIGTGTGTIAIFNRSERYLSLPTSSWAMERREELGEVDISRSEWVEHELNRLIERRNDQRTIQERHRRSEELWQESLERYNAER